MNDDDITLLTPIEVAKRLKVSKDWVYDECAAKRLKSVRLGRNVRIRPADLADYLAKLAE